MVESKTCVIALLVCLFMGTTASAEVTHEHHSHRLFVTGKRIHEKHVHHKHTHGKRHQQVTPQPEVVPARAQ